MTTRDPFDFLGGLDDDFAGGAPAPFPLDVLDRAEANRIEADADRFFDERDGGWTPPAPRQTFRETCRKCNGRGRFIGYSGRDFGACYPCKGVGHFDRITSPSERERARDGRNQRKANVKNERRETFAAAHPAEWAWMLKPHKVTFTFPDDMIRAVEDWGDLTDRQLETVQRMMERDASWATERTTAKVEREASAPVVATDKLMAAFDAAQAKGIKRPKMRFEGFTASLAPATGKNPGAVYIKTTDLDTYLGMIKGGRFLASREATPEQVGKVTDVMADPLASAIAYGRRTGACSICGRELTKGELIDRGIGPICAERFGL